MKISAENSQPTLPAAKSTRAVDGLSSLGRTSEAAATDGVSVSAAAALLAAGIGGAGVESADHESKVVAIMRAVQRGTYQIEIGRLADAIIREDASWPAPKQQR